MPSAITGTTGLAASPTAYSGSNTQLTHAIQTIWSKEILFQAMPILRMEQFAVKKTELGVSPGLQVNFMRYYNLQPPLGPLTEGIRMETNALTSEQIVITVAEQGYAVAVSELLLNSSFDDIMATTSRLLGRNMATFLDNQCYATLSLGTSQLFGYDRSAFAGATTTNVYGAGTVGTTYAGAAATSITGTGGTGAIFLTTASIKDAVETLASKNIPRIGETYVNFLHPHQSRRLRDVPEFIEVTKYAAPGNFMVGEIGRIYDTVFIETTQIKPDLTGVNPGYTSIMIGDNAFGHAISLPVELRDGGVLDFGREHALAWYSIWGLGVITDQSIVKISTN